MLRLLAGIAVLAVLAGCGTSPEQGCKDLFSVSCDQSYKCNSAGKLGTDVASCKTVGAASCVALVNSNTSKSPCDTGKTWNPQNASECISKVQGLSCADYNDANKVPSVCGEICK
jgi:hypothetical protein